MCTEVNTVMQYLLMRRYSTGGNRHFPWNTKQQQQQQQNRQKSPNQTPTIAFFLVILFIGSWILYDMVWGYWWGFLKTTQSLTGNMVPRTNPSPPFCYKYESNLLYETTVTTAFAFQVLISISAKYPNMTPEESSLWILEGHLLSWTVSKREGLSSEEQL